MTDSETKKLNSFFRDFLLLNNCKEYFYDEPEINTIVFIEKNEDIHFHKNWDYMMVLVQFIEKKWKMHNIDTSDNYVKFMFDNNCGFQDKGFNKLDAFYKCCFKSVEAMWKDGKPPFKYESGDPFGLDFDD
jgi:hypothetical protein